MLFVASHLSLAMGVTHKTVEENFLSFPHSTRLLLRLPLASCCAIAWKTCMWDVSFTCVKVRGSGSRWCSLIQAVELGSQLVYPDAWGQRRTVSKSYMFNQKAESRLLSCGLISHQHHQQLKSKIKRQLVLLKCCWKWLQGWWWTPPPTPPKLEQQGVFYNSF